MIFDIDKKNKLSTAIIDDSGNRLTYGDLTIFCDALKRKIPERKLVFCLCKNTAPSLAGFLALYDNKDVSLLLNASIEKGLLDNLYNIYKPEYIWCPSNMEGIGETEIIEEYLGYVLYRTTNDTPALNPDLSLLLTTSGTTGSPKLVRHKYGNIEINAQNVANVFGWNTTERGICDLPMQYTMGLNVINSHLYAGATVLLLSNHLLSPLFWNFIKEQRGTNFTGVPYSYEILKKMKFTQMDLPYLKTMAEGGGKLSNSLFEYFSKYASDNGKRFIATFGTTETSARLAYLPAELATKKCASIGFAIPGGTIVLKDDQGKVVVNSNVEGELCYQGPNVTMGYAESVEDLVKGDEFKGEYCTGDIAFRDEDGCYFIIGRKKRFLKLFGLRVSLDQCEKIIADGLFIDCACSGNDDRMFVYVTEAGKEEQVKKLISIKTGLPLTSFTVKCVDEIYRNESGKINYRKLDNEYGIFKIDNVKIAGISACVPPKQVENIDSILIEDKKELEKYIETTGVKRRYIAEEGICSSDLCLEAAERLIEKLDWEKEEIECLIFVSQTPDYIFPATACVLQDRLKLSSNCMSFDITMSCPGWIYGLSAISAILSAGKIKKGLLLVGETSTKAKSPYDRVNLLAGDAGTATALEFNTSASPIIFDMHTDGSNFKSLIIPDGGYRNPVTKESFEYVMCKDDILRNRLQANMEGDSIFSFAVNTAPKEINALLSKLAVDKADVDYFLIHQANQMINKFIQKRLKVDDSKCIYNITDFGNTSSTSIPLMIISKLREKFNGKKIVCSAFGTGLAWGTMVMDTSTDGVFPELIRYADDKTDN